MIRSIRQFGFFVLLLVLTAIALYPYDSAVRQLANRVAENALESGVSVYVEDARMEFPGKAVFEQGLVRIPIKPLIFPVELRSLTLKPHFSPLLILVGRVDLLLEAYQGEARGEVFGGLFSSEWEFDVSGSGFRLEEHSFLRALGVKGEFRLKARGSYHRDVPRVVQALTSADISLEIDRAGYAGGHKVEGLITLPRVEEVGGEILVSKSDRVASIQRLFFVSSLGTINATASFNFDEIGGLSSSRATVRVELTPEGVKEISPLLALASSDPSAERTKLWSIVMVYRAGSAPSLAISPVN